MTSFNVRCKTCWCLLVIILISVAALPARAAIPDTIDYQGYLTNSSGSPINGTVTITFRIYNGVSVTTSLWSDSQSVTLSNGLFMVKLGSPTNPFPLGMFDAPLWLGIEVAPDVEMSPRVALSSTGFAHKASDADSVGGISPSSLATVGDLSAHEAVASAHHSKTSSFSELADQATDGQIPMSITRDSELNGHAALPAVHHSRYTNAEAVAAMGGKSDSNPLHHDKRSDAQVFAAVTAQDGAGSSLDADLVDGLQASEIIDAASDEVRTPISSLPYTISAPGSYYVTQNLNGAAGGININVDNVTLDLMGFTLDGGGTVADQGIYFVSRNNITIVNGTVRGFGYAGLYQTDTTSHDATIRGIKAIANGALGTIGALYSGIYVASNNTHIEGCVAGGNGGPGLVGGQSAIIINNTVYSSTGNYGIRGDIGSIISGNSVSSHSGNSALWGGASSVIRNNAVYNNSGSYGIVAYSGSTVIANTVYNNSVSAGIFVNSHASLIDNNVYNNSNWGIFGTNSNTVRGNTINNNNTSNTVNEGGLRISFDNQIKDNTLDSNLQNNILILSADNVIEENMLTDSGNGILFNASGNFYANNRASGNTTDYNLGATTQTDGGGNFSY